MTSSTKTSLRANVSSKLSAGNQTVELIKTNLLNSTKSYTHIICGGRGTGKTWIAHSVAKLPILKMTFTDGIIWIGLGMSKSIDYTLLRSIYERICAELAISVGDCLNEVHFSDKNIQSPSGKDKKREKDAMEQMRDAMFQSLLEKNVLICIDGLYDSSDIDFFNFQKYMLADNAKFCVMLTTNGEVEEKDKTKVWSMSNFSVDAAKSFFMDSLEPTTKSSPEFKEKYMDIYQSCQGNPLSIKTLAHLVDDKVSYKNFQALDYFIANFVNVPGDAKIQIFHILENLFKNSSLGESFNKITWRCFVAFSSVFGREECLRPCVSRSPIKALFCAVIRKIENNTMDDIDKGANELIDFLVKTKIFIQIDGLDNGNIPNTFYQMSCDLYQEFGKHLSVSPKTNMKLHQLFLNEYTTIIGDNFATFGCNEMDHFMLKWMPRHLRNSGYLNDQAITLSDSRFVQERIKYMGPIDAAKKHVNDTENLLSMSKDSSDLLLLSYEVFTKHLESKCVSKENMNGQYDNKTEEIVTAMWYIALSLLSHNFVKEGCDLVEKAFGYDDVENPVLDIDIELFQTTATASASDDHLYNARSLVKIGAAIAKSSFREESRTIILLGLQGLIDHLGEETLEVARAHVFVGEILLRDLTLYEEALEHFSLSLPLLLKELGGASDEVVDAIILSAKTYVHNGDLKTASKILEKLAPQLQENAEMNVRFQIASIYIMNGDPTSAHAMLLTLQRRCKDEKLLKQVNIMLDECTHSQRYTI